MSKNNSLEGNTRKKTIGLILFIMLFLAVLPLVSSAPPVLSTIQSGSLEIIAPTFDYIVQGQNMNFYWHVFNTTRLLTNTSVTCDYHLYSKFEEGDHIITVNNVKQFNNGRDFEVSVAGNNFSEIGEYCDLIECNTSIQTGGLERCFLVSTNGEEVTTAKAVFYIGLLAVLLFFLGLSIFGFVSFDNLLSRVGSFGAGYLLMITITFIGWNMADSFLTSSPFLISGLRILFFVFVIGLFPLLIGAFAWYVIMLFKIKEIERLMGKGFSRDEAEHRQGRKFK